MILLINYSHKWWYKALSVLLVVALILAISFGAAPRVHAVGVLTITVCAAILAVMAGAGIATVVSGMTSADIQNWMTGKLNEWDAYRNDGNVFTDMIQNNLITTTVKGTLAIGNAAACGISDFIDWLKSDSRLQDNSSINVINPSSYFGNIPVYIGSYITNKYNQSVISNIDCGWVKSIINNTSNLYALNNQPFSMNGINATQLNANFYILSMYSGNPNMSFVQPVPEVNYDVISVLGNTNSSLELTNSVKSLSLTTDVINIPYVDDAGQTDIIIGIGGVYPGATTEEAADVIMDGVLDNTLDTTMTVTAEYVDAVEAVVINEQPITVNTDHHMIGFTNLPDFVNLNLNSIWHYVSDAVEYASSFISWFVNLLTSVPTLAIPLYMSFTLLIVLSFIRRILL